MLAVRVLAVERPLDMLSDAQSVSVNSNWQIELLEIRQEENLQNWLLNQHFSPKAFSCHCRSVKAPAASRQLRGVYARR